MRSAKEVALHGSIDGAFDVDFLLEDAVDVDGKDGGALLHHLLVKQLGGVVEDVAEDAVVDNLLIVVIRLAQTLDIVVVELQGAAHVAVNGSGGEEGDCLVGCDRIATSGTVRSGGSGGTEAATQSFDDSIALGDGTRLGVDDVLTTLERQLTNGGGTLNEQLEHEA